MPLLISAVLFLPILPALAQPSTVTFTVDMKEPLAKGWFDPATKTVGVRGAQAPLSWGETKVNPAGAR